MKSTRSTIHAIAGLAVALSLCALPTFAKPGDKHKESDDVKRSPSDPRTDQLQQQIKALQKQLEAMEKSDAKEASKGGKEEKRDKDHAKKGEAKGKPEYKKADAATGSVSKDKHAAGGKGKHQKVGRAADAAGVMVPVNQLPPGIAQRFAGQKMASSSLLPPGIARKLTGAGDDEGKRVDQGKPGDYKKADGKAKPGKRGGDDDDDDKKAVKGKGKK